MKRIVMFVEGDGEAEAVPVLIRRLLSEMDAWDTVQIDESPFRVGEVGRLIKDNCSSWKRLLGASLKRKNVGCILLLLDGDIARVDGARFCAKTVAARLAWTAREVGAGTTFSLAVVFACMEFESWLLAGAAKLAGLTLPDGRLIPSDFQAPVGDLDAAPRNAKGWLNQQIQGGYKPTRDQAELTRMLDLEEVRKRELRSFRRLESAISQLVESVRNGNAVATP